MKSIGKRKAMVGASRWSTLGLAAFIACDSPTSPTKTGTNVVDLVIQPPITALKVGEIVALTAVERLADGTQHTVVATWSTDAPAVLAVDAGGVATARSRGTAGITASADGLSSSLKVQAVPDVVGRWSGETVDSDSTRVSGPGPFRPTTGLVRAISFMLQQSGRSISGEGVVDLTPGPVQGTVDVEGRVVLSGTFDNAEGFHAEITEWTSQLNGSGNSLAGQFIVTHRYTNFFGPQVITQKRDIISLTRLQ